LGVVEGVDYAAFSKGCKTVGQQMAEEVSSEEGVVCLEWRKVWLTDSIPDLPPFQELCETIDEQLFDKILLNKQHLLRYLLPPPSAAL